MKLHRLSRLAVLPLGIVCSTAALAERGTGWDIGGDVIYQDAQDIDFEGGSSASLDDDLGIALSFGYRLSSRLEVMFALDWNTVDYEFDVVSDTPGLAGFSGHGDLESWIPRIGLNFNFLETDITPYVTAAVGYAFIDTNIPDSPPYTSCWWDPWWGYYCGTFQSTRSIDEFTYDAGVGVRWDVSSAFTLRLAYEKHWLDLGEANGTPGFDQLKFGISAKY